VLGVLSAVVHALGRFAGVNRTGALGLRYIGGLTMKDPSFILRLRAAAVVVFLLATLGVSPVPRTPLGLAL
jgi:hypothetical protein